jgi:hypothetical protein
MAVLALAPDLRHGSVFEVGLRAKKGRLHSCSAKSLVVSYKITKGEAATSLAVG